MSAHMGVPMVFSHRVSTTIRLMHPRRKIPIHSVTNLNLEAKIHTVRALRSIHLRLHQTPPTIPLPLARTLHMETHPVPTDQVMPMATPLMEPLLQTPRLSFKKIPNTSYGNSSSAHGSSDAYGDSAYGAPSANPTPVVQKDPEPAKPSTDQFGGWG